MEKRELFKVEGDKITRLRRHCPKCGDGVFLAEHKNRFSCGNCGYTEFKGGGRKIPEKPVKEEEPVKIEEKPETKEEPPKEEPKEEKPEEKPKEESTEPENKAEEPKEGKQKTEENKQ